MKQLETGWKLRNKDPEDPLALLTSPAPDSVNADAYGSYRIAGQNVITDLGSPWLEPFRIVGADADFSGRPDLLQPRPQPSDPELRTAFEGQDWIGHRQVSVSCRYSDDLYVLKIVGAGKYAVWSDGSGVECTNLAPDISHDEAVIALLGAPLILACALRNTWCLHASAVAFDGGVIAFVGESGQGKSTLARFLAENGGAIFEHVSDDILPVAVDQTEAHALPRYPQFKLPLDRQPSRRLAESIPLRAVLALDHSPVGSTEVELARLNGADGALRIAGNTVASRLFGRRLLADHLSFCSRMAISTPIYALKYPRRRELLPQVRNAIRRHLAATN